MKTLPRLLIVIAVAGAAAAVLVLRKARSPAPPDAAAPPAAPAVRSVALPRLVDLGAKKCIPCKMMAPILEDLTTSMVGRLEVEFIDVWEKPEAAEPYNIDLIPTQIFFGPDGRELHRHEGFISKEDILATWRELGVDLGPRDEPKPFSRRQPARPDARDRASVCQLCDGDIASNRLVVIGTPKGDVRLCGMHHYFVLYSCLTEDTTGIEKRVQVADWSTGQLVPAAQAVYLAAPDATSGRPAIKAFGARAAAESERQAGGGELIDLAALQEKELANRCGFCDRAVYPEDAAAVTVGDRKTWGCCSHCALGVAARTGEDIEVRERDRLTGAPVVVKTLNGSVASLEPASAVAWYGQRTKPDGTHASAGCFHQGFFVSADSLRAWVEANPLETGEMISIGRALADKMKLTPQQIGKACKIGECAPR